MARSRGTDGAGLNEELIKLLEQLRWSRRGFAHRVHARCQAIGLPHTVSPSTVSRWCKNETTPSGPLAAAACHVLSGALRHRVTPESLGWPADPSDIATDSLEYTDLPHAVRMLSRLWELDSVPDRSLVKNTFLPGVFGPASREALVMPADADLAGRGTNKATAADIELIEDQTQLYGRLDAQHGGGKFRSVFAAFLATHTTPLLNGSFSAKAGRRLYGSVADAALAMASMAYDDHLPGLAQRYDLQAMRLAQAIGDRDRITRVHIHQARLAAAQGDRREVLTHARSAVLACDGASSLVKAYAAITEARAWAFNQSPQRTEWAVGRARETFDRARQGSGVDWLSWFDRHELEGQAAWAFAVAGMAEAGTKAWEEAQDMPAERKRDRVELLITGAWLARLRGDEAQHVELAQRAAEQARHLISRRLTLRIKRLTSGQPLDEF
ncbi:transcriptional regulator (plasmid) [Streptomyces sp. R39]|uniref:Transcriptional regulator n=1 Tax=Streptomyces sp. R39 TaxID=3238631 RepID=A0AB39R2A6_9ACTN